jgi:hypothetical protein
MKPIGVPPPPSDPERAPSQGHALTGVQHEVLNHRHSRSFFRELLESHFQFN